MHKRACILLSIFILVWGCAPSSSSVNQATTNALLAVVTLPIKIVGAAVAAAVGAAAGMGFMPVN